MAENLYRIIENNIRSCIWIEKLDKYLVGTGEFRDSPVSDELLIGYWATRVSAIKFAEKHLDVIREAIQQEDVMNNIAIEFRILGIGERFIQYSIRSNNNYRYIWQKTNEKEGNAIQCASGILSHFELDEKVIRLK